MKIIQKSKNKYKMLIILTVFLFFSIIHNFKVKNNNSYENSLSISNPNKYDKSTISIRLILTSLDINVNNSFGVVFPHDRYFNFFTKNSFNNNSIPFECNLFYLVNYSDMSNDKINISTKINSSSLLDTDSIYNNIALCKINEQISIIGDVDIVLIIELVFNIDIPNIINYTGLLLYEIYNDKKIISFSLPYIGNSIIYDFNNNKNSLMQLKLVSTISNNTNCLDNKNCPIYLFEYFDLQIAFVAKEYFNNKNVDIIIKIPSNLVNTSATVIEIRLFNKTKNIIIDGSYLKKLSNNNFVHDNNYNDNFNKSDETIYNKYLLKLGEKYLAIDSKDKINLINISLDLNDEYILFIKDLYANKSENYNDKIFLLAYVKSTKTCLSNIFIKGINIHKGNIIVDNKTYSSNILNSIYHPDYFDIFSNSLVPLVFSFSTNINIPKNSYLVIQHYNYHDGSIIHFIPSTCDLYNLQNNSINYGVENNVSRPICYYLDKKSIINSNSIDNNSFNSSMFIKLINGLQSNLIYKFSVFINVDKCFDTSLYNKIKYTNLSFKYKIFSKLYNSKNNLIKDNILFADINLLAKSEEIKMIQKCYNSEVKINYNKLDNNNNNVEYKEITDFNLGTVDNIIINNKNPYVSLNTIDSVKQLQNNFTGYLYSNDLDLQIKNSNFMSYFKVNMFDANNFKKPSDYIPLPIIDYTTDSNSNLEPDILNGRLRILFNSQWLSHEENYNSCYFSWAMSMSYSKQFNLLNELDNESKNKIMIKNKSIDIKHSNLANNYYYSNELNIIPYSITSGRASEMSNWNYLSDSYKNITIDEVDNANVFYYTNCFKVKSDINITTTSIYKSFEYQIQWIDDESNENFSIIKVKRFFKLFSEIGVFNNADKIFYNTSKNFGIYSSGISNIFAENNNNLNNNLSLCILSINNFIDLFNKLEGNTLSLYLNNAYLLNLNYEDSSDLYSYGPISSYINVYYNKNSNPNFFNNQSNILYNDSVHIKLKNSNNSSILDDNIYSIDSGLYIPINCIDKPIIQDSNSSYTINKSQATAKVLTYNYYSNNKQSEILNYVYSVENKDNNNLISENIKLLNLLETSEIDINKFNVYNSKVTIESIFETNKNFLLNKKDYTKKELFNIKIDLTSDTTSFLNNLSISLLIFHKSISTTNYSNLAKTSTFSDYINTINIKLLNNSNYYTNDFIYKDIVLIISNKNYDNLVLDNIDFPSINKLNKILYHNYSNNDNILDNKITFFKFIDNNIFTNNNNFIHNFNTYKNNETNNLLHSNKSIISYNYDKYTTYKDLFKENNNNILNLIAKTSFILLDSIFKYKSTYNYIFRIDFDVVFLESLYIGKLSYIDIKINTTSINSSKCVVMIFNYKIECNVKTQDNYSNIKCNLNVKNFNFLSDYVNYLGFKCFNLVTIDKVFSIHYINHYLESYNNSNKFDIYTLDKKFSIDLDNNTENKSIHFSKIYYKDFYLKNKLNSIIIDYVYLFKLRSQMKIKIYFDINNYIILYNNSIEELSLYYDYTQCNFTIRELKQKDIENYNSTEEFEDNYANSIVGRCSLENLETGNPFVYIDLNQNRLLLDADNDNLYYLYNFNNIVIDIFPIIAINNDFDNNNILYSTIEIGEDIYEFSNKIKEDENNNNNNNNNNNDDVNKEIKLLEDNSLIYTSTQHYVQSLCNLSISPLILGEKAIFTFYFNSENIAIQKRSYFISEAIIYYPYLLSYKSNLLRYYKLDCLLDNIECNCNYDSFKNIIKINLLNNYFDFGQIEQINHKLQIFDILLTYENMFLDNNYYKENIFYYNIEYLNKENYVNNNFFVCVFSNYDINNRTINIIHTGIGINKSIGEYLKLYSNSNDEVLGNLFVDRLEFSNSDVFKLKESLFDLKLHLSVNYLNKINNSIVNIVKDLSPILRIIIPKVFLFNTKTNNITNNTSNQINTTDNKTINNTSFINDKRLNYLDVKLFNINYSNLNNLHEIPISNMFYDINSNYIDIYINKSYEFNIYTDKLIVKLENLHLPDDCHSCLDLDIYKIKPLLYSINNSLILRTVSYLVDYKLLIKNSYLLMNYNKSNLLINSIYQYNYDNELNNNFFINYTNETNIKYSIGFFSKNNEFILKKGRYTLFNLSILDILLVDNSIEEYKNYLNNNINFKDYKSTNIYLNFEKNSFNIKKHNSIITNKNYYTLFNVNSNINMPGIHYKNYEEILIGLECNNLYSETINLYFTITNYKDFNSIESKVLKIDNLTKGTIIFYNDNLNYSNYYQSQYLLNSFVLNKTIDLYNNKNNIINYRLSERTTEDITVEVHINSQNQKENTSNLTLILNKNTLFYLINLKFKLKEETTYISFNIIDNKCFKIDNSNNNLLVNIIKNKLNKDYLELKSLNDDKNNEISNFDFLDVEEYENDTEFQECFDYNYNDRTNMLYVTIYPKKLYSLLVCELVNLNYNVVDINNISKDIIKDNLDDEYRIYTNIYQDSEDKIVKSIVINNKTYKENYLFEYKLKHDINSYNLNCVVKSFDTNKNYVNKITNFNYLVDKDNVLEFPFCINIAFNITDEDINKDDYNTEYITSYSKINNELKFLLYKRCNDFFMEVNSCLKCDEIYRDINDKYLNGIIPTSKNKDLLFSAHLNYLEEISNIKTNEETLEKNKQNTNNNNNNNNNNNESNLTNIFNRYYRLCVNKHKDKLYCPNLNKQLYEENVSKFILNTLKTQETLINSINIRQDIEGSLYYSKVERDTSNTISNDNLKKNISEAYINIVNNALKEAKLLNNYSITSEADVIAINDLIIENIIYNKENDAITFEGYFKNNFAMCILIFAENKETIKYTSNFIDNCYINFIQRCKIYYFSPNKTLYKFNWNYNGFNKGEYSLDGVCFYDVTNPVIVSNPSSFGNIAIK